MKTFALALAFVLPTGSLLAQGTVNFVNRITGTLDAPVSLWSWGGPLGPAVGGGDTPTTMLVAQLYASPVGGTLTAVGAPIPFRSGVGAGYWVGAARTIPMVPEAGAAQVKVVAWSTALGSTYEQVIAQGMGGFGESGVLTLNTGGGLLPPAALSGLQGFSVFFVPEPSSPSLLLLGALATWAGGIKARHRGGRNL